MWGPPFEYSCCPSVGGMRDAGFSITSSPPTPRSLPFWLKYSISGVEHLRGHFVVPFNFFPTRPTRHPVGCPGIGTKEGIGE